MHNGYIKAYRKIVYSPVFGDSKKFKLWFLCLCKVTHTEHKQYVGNQILVLEKGQFVTGRQSLAREYNKGEKPSEIVSEHTLWRWLKMFEKDGMLHIESSTKYSVITVLNWNYYQLGEQ